jgi:hypothetical protein
MRESRFSVERNPWTSGGATRDAAIRGRRELAWRPTLNDGVEVVRRAFGVERAEWLASGRPGNEGRLVAVYLARRLTAQAVDGIGRFFGGTSIAAISKTVQRVESRGSAPGGEPALGCTVGRTDSRTCESAPSSRFGANQVTGQDLTPSRD